MGAVRKVEIGIGRKEAFASFRKLKILYHLQRPNNFLQLLSLIQNRNVFYASNYFAGVFCVGGQRSIWLSRSGRLRRWVWWHAALPRIQSHGWRRTSNGRWWKTTTH